MENKGVRAAGKSGSNSHVCSAQLTHPVNMDQTKKLPHDITSLGVALIPSTFARRVQSW
jgi:hypothetical protein